ncbi:hypothetical protein [Chitinilyticum piscinae]|uniref:Uncharacterized protein n=1 Tax=Chitinilyticum piscinae TaxID=2866724 RepID=A0A8J7FH33_9NEIS|nr:hypothetical protein [Chitinilyticum piscinae]MBE9609055.1 hypothetical protein [Chitinilyticum piscinae]
MAVLMVLAVTAFIPLYLSYRIGVRKYPDGGARMWCCCASWLFIFTAPLSLDTLIGLPYAWAICSEVGGLHRDGATIPSSIYINLDHVIVTGEMRRWLIIRKPEGQKLTINGSEIFDLVVKKHMLLELSMGGRVSRFETLNKSVGKCVPTELNSDMDLPVFSGLKVAGCLLVGDEVQGIEAEVETEGRHVAESKPLILCLRKEFPQQDQLSRCLKMTGNVVRTAPAEVVYEQSKLPFLPKVERFVLSKDGVKMASYGWVNHANRSWLPWLDWPLSVAFPGDCVCRLDPKTPIFWSLLSSNDSLQ